MSYPYTVQTLVVEDDPDSKMLYDACFEQLTAENSVAPCRYAFSYQDGEEALNDNAIFHLVILDLRLPETSGRPPIDGLDYGLTLLDKCINRDRYPIPALLVISAQLGQADQHELEERVRNGFSYGRVLVKGPRLEKEIQSAVKAVQEYNRVGIHLAEGGERKFPTLSPRDDDLLRRCVLKQDRGAGVDLTWWSANLARMFSQFPGSGGWTKVLVGRLLFEEGKGSSRPLFFKFAPAAGAASVHSDAALMGLKLGHIKHCSANVSGDRSLLVTHAVGNSDALPISLEEFLGRPTGDVMLNLPRLVERLCNQVSMLGVQTPNMLPISRLLWSGHSNEGIDSQWMRWQHGRLVLSGNDPGTNPARVLDELTRNTHPVSYTSQACNHGDLNITNVALDMSPDTVDAYIFDAANMTPAVNVRDLAMLEVTSLLHQPPDGEQGLVGYCAAMYDDFVVAPENMSLGDGSDRNRNTLKFIAEIRKHALKRACGTIYALMVFDAAIMQLGGLAYEVSGNKITNPTDAALLGTLVADWLRRVAPEFFNKPSEVEEVLTTTVRPDTVDAYVPVL